MPESKKHSPKRAEGHPTVKPVTRRTGAWLVPAAAAIRSGRVVAVPFERLFGLAADALDSAAVARVAAIKGRPTDSAGRQPIAVVVPDRQAVHRVAASFPPLAQRLAERFWPGPLTLLLEALPGIPAPLVSPSGLIGVRWPGPCMAADLAEETATVLTATSANPGGGEDVLSHEELADLGGLAYVAKGHVAGPPGSTVVDVTGAEPVVLRAGIVDLSKEA